MSGNNSRNISANDSTDLLVNSNIGSQNDTYSVTSNHLDKYKKRMDSRAAKSNHVPIKNEHNGLKNKPNHRVSKELVGATGPEEVRSSNTYFGKYKNKQGLSAPYQPSKHVTFCDYCKFSTRTIDERNESISELTETGGIFDLVGISIHDRNKGGNGYDHSFELKMINPDDSDDVFNAGFFYFSDEGRNKGGHLELKGKPCKYLQNEYPEQWNSMLDLLEYNGWNVAKMDLALDIHGDQAREYGLTIPRLDIKAGKGLFKSDKLKDNGQTKQTRHHEGDWSDINDSPDVTYSNYNPLIHCMDGLTIYVGSKRSPDRWRCYEKTKELLSKGKGLPEQDSELAWIRIEHIMRRTTNKPIPWNALRQPDKHFSRDRKGLIAIMQRIRRNAKLKRIESVLSETRTKEKNMGFYHRAFWASQAVKSFIADAEKTEIPDDVIYRLLKRDVSNGELYLLLNPNEKDYTERPIMPSEMRL